MSLRRVLIVQPYGIGDLLFLTPVFRALRLIPSVECVDLLLGSRTEAVVEANPHIDEVMVVDKDLIHSRGGMENFGEVLRLGKKLRDKKYDLLLDYSLRGEYGFSGVFFLGIPHRAGFDYKRRGFFHNIRLPLASGYQGRHVVDYVCDLAEAAGVPVKDRFLEFYLNGEERHAVGNLLMKRKIGESFLAVSPGGGESWGKDAHFKQWPVSFFAELVEELKSRMNIEGVVILGSPREKQMGEELAQKIKGPVTNLAGDVPLRMAAAVLERAAFFTGNDGGLMHLARALNVPLAALYGPVDPQVYGPYPPGPDAIAVYKENLACRPCYQKFRYKADCPDRGCLQDLRPAEVLEFLEEKKYSFLAAILSGEKPTAR